MRDQLLKKENLCMDLAARTKGEAIDELCRLAADRCGLPFESAREVVLEREALGSTGVGGGVALPHGRSPLLAGPVIIAARSVKGLDFESVDGRPTHVFVLLLAPADDNGVGGHLRILARLGSFFSDREHIAAIMAARDLDAFYEALAAL